MLTLQILKMIVTREPCHFQPNYWGFICCVTKKGSFWAIFCQFFISVEFFRPFMNNLNKMWIKFIVYNSISFKQSKNHVKRTFLAPSNNYHALLAAKPNQNLEVCYMLIYIEVETMLKSMCKWMYNTRSHVRIFWHNENLKLI